ncbi:MAG: valine--tRNA ligase, partial [Patescibacteria group bacterium]
MINEKFLKPYNPKETEDDIYKKWEESGFFNPNKLPERHKEPFSIVLPPPNATGTLHIGGALMTVIEDIIVRYKRMSGFKTLWLPGTDHAAIATNAKVEKILQKEEGKSRHDLGREEFIKKVESFVEENRETIKHQIKKMGASLDWSREAFTLDDKRNLAVRTAFKEMYDAGLIYRDYKVINWDPKGQTTISDDEIVYEERDAKLYTFKYSFDFPIAIATTRPETKLGDTAVAVHPSDERYKEYIGKIYKVNFTGAQLSIKIVADEGVDKEFGTGALGVTPAHSQIDAEIASKNDLPSVQVINEYARISLPIEGLEGEKVSTAREKIVTWLKNNNLLIKEEDVKQNVSTAERTGGIIEPLPKMQWFVDVNKPIDKRDGKTLKELMQTSVSDSKIKILPERFEKNYFHWIENLRDWNISRQIWYGHRIPVWYKGEEIYVGIEAPKKSGWIQDEDTLDTWFSSGLWTFSTLGWPEKTEDLANFHPTDILETGYDILFFWVARMILMSEFLLGEVPFKTVYLHGLVRNEKGEKISKSLGGNVDPLEIIEKYGADALRMALIVGVGAGADSKLGNDKLKAYKNFANKIWNASRYVLENTADFDKKEVELTKEDEEYLKNFKEIMKDVTSDMDEYRFHLAGEKLYHYFWHTFADIIIE